MVVGITEMNYQAAEENTTMWFTNKQRKVYSFEEYYQSVLAYLDTFEQTIQRYCEDMGWGKSNRGGIR